MSLLLNGRFVLGVTEDGAGGYHAWISLPHGGRAEKCGCESRAAAWQWLTETANHHWPSQAKAA